MLHCPRRRQRREQIVELKRAGLASGQDRFRDVRRDQGQRRMESLTFSAFASSAEDVSAELQAPLRA